MEDSKTHDQPSTTTEVLLLSVDPVCQARNSREWASAALFSRMKVVSPCIPMLVSNPLISCRAAAAQRDLLRNKYPKCKEKPNSRALEKIGRLEGHNESKGHKTIELMNWGVWSHKTGSRKKTTRLTEVGFEPTPFRTGYNT